MKRCDDEILNAYREKLKADGWQEQPCDYWVSPCGVRMTLGLAVEIVKQQANRTLRGGGK